MLKVKRTELLCFACFSFGILIALVGFLTEEVMLQNVGVFCLFTANVLYGAARFYDRVFFLAFQVTFFTFLLGRTMFHMLTGRRDTYGFTEKILFHTNFCLVLALISLLVGYVAACYLKKHIKFNDINERESTELGENDYNSERYQSIRTVSKWFYYATFPFDMLIGIEKFLLVSTVGYAEYYVSYVSKFPYAVTKLADVCIVAFFVFLASFPSKKEIKLPIILYIIHAVVSLGSGKRQEFIIPLILLILYFCVRNKIRSGGSPWIQKKNFGVILILLPCLLVTMYTFNVSRFSTSGIQLKSQKNIIDQIAGFFENTGFSVNVISFEKYYEDIIPDKCYSFGDTIDYLRENVLTQLFFDFPVYKTQTAEKALYGNNFSQTITYIRSPRYYLSGRGYGSCYIAEAYHDFGYVGIIFWSILFSFVLVFMYDFKNKGIIFVTISLSVLHYILIAPRNMASAFISEMINVNTWLVIFTICLIAKLLRSTGKNTVKRRNFAARSASSNSRLLNRK